MMVYTLAKIYNDHLLELANEKCDSRVSEEKGAELPKLFIFPLPIRNLDLSTVNRPNDTDALSQSLCKMVTVHKQGWSYPEGKLGIPCSEVGDPSNIIPALAFRVLQPNIACMLPTNNLDIWLKRFLPKKKLQVEQNISSAN